MSDMDLVLHTDGPAIEFLADTWRNEENNNEFQSRIQNAVNWNNPWALLSQRPDGDVFVFGCDAHGVWMASRWGTRVRLMFAPGEKYEDEERDHD